MVLSKKKGSFVKEGTVVKRNHKKPRRRICFINTIVCSFLIKLVSSDMAAKFSLKPGRGSAYYSSPSPRFDAESSPSFGDGQMNSYFTPSPVSYSTKLAVSPVKVGQVFFNFRGDQLRHNFVSHLSDAFQRHGIKFFIDKDEKRGEDLKNLFVRIEESNIALAIFSTRYSESRWCMDELVTMKKLVVSKKLRVIPIFYKVEAGDVRNPTRGSEFGNNFWNLVELVSCTSSGREKIKHWLEALECICGQTGLPLGEKSSESDFIYKIVKSVKEAIGLEEEKPFWVERIKAKVRNFSYLLAAS